MSALILDLCARVHLANGVNYWYLEGVRQGSLGGEADARSRETSAPSLRSSPFSFSILISPFLLLTSYSPLSVLHAHFELILLLSPLSTALQKKP